MIWKVIRGFVVLLSITLAFPPQTAAGKSQPKQKVQVSSHRGADVTDQHPTNVKVTSVGSLRYDKNKHDQPGSLNKEPALIRLKRIKREIQTSSSKLTHSKYEPAHVEVLAKVPEKTSKIGNLEGGKARIDQAVFHDFGSSRMHTDMLRKLEDVNRKINKHGKGHSGRVVSLKNNEIGHGRLRAIDQYRVSAGTAGSNSYGHHKHEHEDLDRDAGEIAAQRQKNRKKNKQQRNRNEFNPKELRMKNYPLVPRQRLAGTKFSGSEIARSISDGSIKERNRGHAEDIRQFGIEGKHRARRGQRSSLPSAGSQAKDVRFELERIKRMQRDLMKEITHLEHMRTKKKRSTDRLKNQDLGKVTQSKRK